MLRQLARLPLRRGLHSQAGPSSRLFTRYARSAYALGASAAVVGYLAWSWNPDGRHIPRISLDSEAVSAPHQQPASSSSPSPTSVSPPKPSSHTPTLSPLASDMTEAVTASTEGEEPSPGPSGTLEEEDGAEQESSGGAFNPQTGEINWDCPCLGGMAHGPCGQQFREAFSCFVYSEADPKGIDCVEKFKAMQECFREHPEVYADEIMDDDEESPAGALTTEKAEGDFNVSDSPSLPTTEQAPTSTLS